MLLGVTHIVRADKLPNVSQMLKTNSPDVDNENVSSDSESQTQSYERGFFVDRQMRWYVQSCCECGEDNRISVVQDDISAGGALGPRVWQV